METSNATELYAIVQFQLGGPEFSVFTENDKGSRIPVLYRSREQGWREIIDSKIMELQQYIGIQLQDGRLVRDEIPEDMEAVFTNDEVPMRVTIFGTLGVIKVTDGVYPDITIEHEFVGEPVIEEDRFMKKIIIIHHRKSGTTNRGWVEHEVLTTVAETIERARLALGPDVVLEYWVDPLGKIHELTDTNVQL